MRILPVILVLSSTGGLPSLCAAACITDGPVSQVGMTSSSAEQSTFGYACIGEEQPDLRVIGRIQGNSIQRFGAETSDPEKETYGYPLSSSPDN